jgi:putative membrane protein
VTVQTFVPCVQDLQQETHHSVMRCASFVQKCVMLVLLNVENIQHTIAAKSVQKHAKNVLPNAATLVKSNELKISHSRVPRRDSAHEKNNRIINNGRSKVMFYEGYHFWGMHLLWWFVWIILLFWIFATPYDIPGQRKKKDSPLDILQKRFASGQISTEEYHEKKKILENDLAKHN